MLAAKDMVVSIDYKLTDPEGQVLDSSEGREPLAYLHGHSQIVSGLEQALEGAAEGSHHSVPVPAKAGYGERDERLITVISRAEIGIEEELPVGAQLQVQHPDGGAGIVQVVKVEGEQITLDANHPLAGMDLHFEVDVRAVRAATEEELGHGHAHGEGGHHH